MSCVFVINKPQIKVNELSCYVKKDEKEDYEQMILDQMVFEGSRIIHGLQIPS